MRLKLIYFTLVTMLLVHQSAAFTVCEIFKTCPTSTISPATAPSASALPSGIATQVPSPTSNVAPSSSIAPTPSSSSIVSSIKPSSSIPSSIMSSSVASSSSIPSLTTALSSTTVPSLTSTVTPSTSSDSSSGSSNNIGVIVGSVCGFVAIIGAGFAYAFFSKTRRRNERNQRLYSQNGADDFNNHGNNSYQSDPFNSRPSPAMAASAVAAADHIHSQQPAAYNYGNMAPQLPMVAIAKNNDPYYNYNTAPDTYYNQQQYYDPNAGYYDHTYMDSQKQQHYDPYGNVPPPPQHQSPNLTHTTTTMTNSNVYQTPHAYADEHQPHTPNSYR